MHAQQVDFKFVSVGKNKGLSNSNTTCIVQDSTGYIWIGTEDGLNRYDGYKYHVYRKLHYDSTSLPDNSIKSLYVDRMGQLWVGTVNGVCKYKREIDAFQQIITPKNLLEHEAINVIFLTGDNKNQIYFSIGNYLYEINKDNNGAQLIAQIEYGDINHIEFDVLNNMWLGVSRNGGLYYMDKEGKILKHYLHTDTGRQTINTSSILDINLRNNKLWIATDGGGINCFDLYNGTFTYYLTKGPYERYAFYLYTDYENRLWSCDYTGLKLYSDKEDKFINYSSDPGNVYAILPHITAIFQDMQENFWTLHAPGGVGLSVIPKGFYSLSVQLEANDNISNISIMDVCEDDQQRIWMANYFGGIHIYESKTHRVETYYFEPGVKNSLGEGSIFDLHWDGEKMWLGSYLGGLQFFRESRKDFITYKHNPNDSKSIAGNDIRAIDMDREGNIWITIHGKGVDKFNPKVQEFTHYINSNSNLSNDWTYDILCASNGDIWVASVWGLNRMIKGTNRFIGYYQDSTENSLSSNETVCLHEDNAGNIWIGTRRGLNKYNKKTDDFTKYINGFTNNFIQAILNDTEGNIWVSTQNGLARLNPANGLILNINKSDGLLTNEFNPRSAFMNKNNVLYFGSNKGVNFFIPKNLKFNKKVPKVVISDLRLFNESIKDYSGSILKENITIAKEIYLSYNQNVFTFEFLALNMIHPENNQYAYMMEGFENGWNYVGNKREATYTNLNPGEYTFRVKASNNDGEWNNKGASIKVIVSPPWWKTLVARLALVLSIIMFTIVLISLRTRQLKNQKLELAEQVMQRTKEIMDKNKQLEEKQKRVEEQAKELRYQSENLSKANDELTKSNKTKDTLFSIIAHDLISPFNAILGFSDILSTMYHELDEEERIQMLTNINNSSKTLYSLLENLLHWAKTQTGQMKTNPEKINLELLVKETAQVLLNQIKDKKLSVNLKNTEEEDLQAMADKNMTKTILRNLFSNAIKFSNEGDAINITISKDRKFAKMAIRDSGVGIESDDLKKLKEFKVLSSTEGTKGEKGSGLGLILCDDFIKRNGGKFYIESEVGKGSTFSFTLPLA